MGQEKGKSTYPVYPRNASIILSVLMAILPGGPGLDSTIMSLIRDFVGDG